MPDPFNFSRPYLAGPTGPAVEHLLVRRPLDRILSFTGRSIDDVVNDPLVKREIAGYYKLSRSVDRASETHDLERQWNPLGRRVS